MTTTSTFTSVDPVAQTSTASYATVAGSLLNTERYRVISYTIENQDLANSLTWKVIAGNISDLSDAVVVQNPAAVGAGAFGSFSSTTTPFHYYAVQIIDTVGGSHAAALVHGITKI